MSGRLGSISFASEQALGGSRQATQQDRVRLDVVRAADGQRVVLAVVADGEGHRRAGEAAEAVIQNVFQAVEKTASRSLPSALREGLEAGGRALHHGAEKWEGKASVAATAVAIHRGRAYVASVGHTRAYRVREARTAPIGPIDSRLLGGPDSVDIWAGEPDGLALMPGDQIVLASDGLTQVSPEDSRPYVDPNDVARHVQGNPPLEAARHLISMALGRDVLDNVSVAVIQVAIRKERSRWPLAVLGAAVFVALAGVAGVLVAPLFTSTPTPGAPADLGYAVVVEGSARTTAQDGQGQTVGNLGTIPAGVSVVALSDLRLSLQTRSNTGGDISALTLYLASGGQLELTTVDLGVQTPQTVITLQAGRLLVDRGGGTRETWVHAGGQRVGLAASGVGMMGVSLLVDGVTVDCLVGRCAAEVGTSEEVVFELFDAPAQITIAGSRAGSLQSVPTEAIRAWNSLCGGCLPSP